MSNPLPREIAEQFARGPLVQAWAHAMANMTIITQRNFEFWQIENNKKREAFVAECLRRADKRRRRVKR